VVNIVVNFIIIDRRVDLSGDLVFLEYLFFLTKYNILAGEEHYRFIESIKVSPPAKGKSMVLYFFLAIFTIAWIKTFIIGTKSKLLLKNAIEFIGINN